MWCTGFLTEEKLRLEVDGADRSYVRSSLARRHKQDSVARVASFNGVLASLAVADVLQLVLGYAPALTIRKQYDGMAGTVSEVLVKKDEDCPKCSSVLAAGDPPWG